MYLAAVVFDIAAGQDETEGGECVRVARLSEFGRVKRFENCETAKLTPFQSVFHGALS